MPRRAGAVKTTRLLRQQLPWFPGLATFCRVVLGRSYSWISGSILCLQFFQQFCEPLDTPKFILFSLNELEWILVFGGTLVDSRTPLCNKDPQDLVRTKGTPQTPSSCSGAALWDQPQCPTDSKFRRLQQDESAEASRHDGGADWNRVE